MGPTIVRYLFLLLLCPMRVSGVTSCEGGKFKANETGRVTCNFDQDLSVTKKGFHIEYYPDFTFKGIL